MQIKKINGMSKKQFTQVNTFYKDGFKYTLKVAENSDTIVIYKENNGYFERQEFQII